MKKEKEYAFDVTEISMLQGMKIITDLKTGVQYLFYGGGFAGGLTPLLDSDGKPKLSKTVNPENNKRSQE